MLAALRTIAWITCVIYSTIPLFWLMIHPWVKAWRQTGRSPFRVLVPAWIVMWMIMAALTAPWREVSLYSTRRVIWWSWIPAALLFAAGMYLYSRAGAHFSWVQLSGLPELSPAHPEQRLVTTGIRARVRHPIYLGHFCEVLAWTVGTGLAVCWLLTVLAILTGALMIRMEDSELEKRFGEEYAIYRKRVPSVFPRVERRIKSDATPRL